MEKESMTDIYAVHMHLGGSNYTYHKSQLKSP
jgi:hypothetical protein